MHSLHRRSTAEPHPPVSARRSAILRERERARPRRPRHWPIRPVRASLPSLPAVIAATLLFTTYALPAYADPAPHTLEAPSRAQGVAQTLIVAAGASEDAAIRDGYTVTLPAPAPVRIAAASAAYARTASTFVNDATSPVQWPFDRGVPITSGFGYRIAPCAACSSNHSGVDFAPGAGTPIQAIADGVVTKSGNGGELGVNVAIDHVVDGERITSVYAHMLVGSTAVDIGDTVSVGQLVGLVGNTGESTGPHLHLTLLRDGDLIDPFAWLKEKVGS